MDLNEYLSAQEKKFPGKSAERALARKIAKSGPTINRIRNRLQTPSPPTANAIVEATDGAVTLADLYPAAPRKAAVMAAKKRKQRAVPKSRRAASNGRG